MYGGPTAKFALYFVGRLVRKAKLALTVHNLVLSHGKTYFITAKLIIGLATEVPFRSGSETKFFSPRFLFGRQRFMV